MTKEAASIVVMGQEKIGLFIGSWAAIHRLAYEALRVTIEAMHTVVMVKEKWAYSLALELPLPASFGVL